MREGRAFLLVYSVTNRSTFDDIRSFRDRILLVNEEEGTVPMVLVANKIDLDDQRQVSTTEGAALAAEFDDIPFVECSALKAINCDTVFHAAVREIRKIDSQRQREGQHMYLICFVCIFLFVLY